MYLILSNQPTSVEILIWRNKDGLLSFLTIPESLFYKKGKFKCNEMLSLRVLSNVQKFLKYYF